MPAVYIFLYWCSEGLTFTYQPAMTRTHDKLWLPTLPSSSHSPNPCIVSSYTSHLKNLLDRKCTAVSKKLTRGHTEHWWPAPVSCWQGASWAIWIQKTVSLLSLSPFTWNFVIFFGKRVLCNWFLPQRASMENDHQSTQACTNCLDTNTHQSLY
jgi:hypothetical protein